MFVYSLADLPLVEKNGVGGGEEGERGKGKGVPGRRRGLTVQLLQYPVHGAGAARAGHADVELVRVFVRHFGMCLT